MYNKLWNQFSRGWNLVFWPPQALESHTSLRLATPRCARTPQLLRSVWDSRASGLKKLNFSPRLYWFHSELDISVKHGALFHSTALFETKFRYFFALKFSNRSEKTDWLNLCVKTQNGLYTKILIFWDPIFGTHAALFFAKTMNPLVGRPVYCAPPKSRAFAQCSFLSSSASSLP